MYKDRLIAVVIPSHNEAAHIADVIKSLPEFVDHAIVVDDCSDDDTSQAAQATGDPRVTILAPEVNQGVGGATILGYEHALKIHCDVIVKMDGDGQMPSEHLTDLLNAIVDQGFDYAKGNRFLAGESLSQMPKVRLFGNVVLTFMTKLASGYWHVFDPQNGYTAITARALRLLNLNQIHRRFFFENDMLVALNYFSLRVTDVAIPSRYGTEQSDLNPLHVGVTFPWLLLMRFVGRIYQRYVLRDFSPVALFLLLGLLLFFWGFGFGVYLWIETWITGRATPTGTIMLSLLPLILGFQLLLQAIVLDIYNTPR
ncbi:MAG TPA: glycosyltransferase family 2 protein [Blastocatellia bacterium]|nr:glycosyltransferase family 2 protein [Blastocatellia bacterium]